MFTSQRTAINLSILLRLTEQEGKEGRRRSFGCEEARGQACVQPTFREEAKVFWHWTGYPAKEGSYTLRQMAQVSILFDRIISHFSILWQK